MKTSQMIPTLLITCYALSGCSDSNTPTRTTSDAAPPDAGTQPSNNGSNYDDCATDDDCQRNYEPLEGRISGPFDASALECRKVGETRSCFECDRDEDCPEGYGCNQLCYFITQPCELTSECPAGFYCEDRDRCLPIVGYDMGTADAGTDGDMNTPDLGPAEDMGTNSDMSTD